MPDSFRYYLRVYYLRVRFSECDAQKIVFNARYGEYVDLATTEFLRAIGFMSLLDYRLVKQTLEWKAPATFDQVLELSVAAARLGTTSFTLATTFRVAGTGVVTTRAETVYVVIDPETSAKAPLPPEFRAALERGAPGVRTDHAGYLNVLT